MKTYFRHLSASLIGLLLLTLALAACGSAGTTGSTGKIPVRLGYFPNLTHAVALVGVNQGTFQKALGAQTDLQSKVFNAGPALIEALFAGQVDLGYVGPNPAINGYTKSHGAALRVIAGAASGGALFVVRSDEHFQGPQDLANKTFATPQLGGTQDVALRYYLQQHGLQTADKGGNVRVLPTDNPNILTLFKQHRIDGAWVPEPWATRLLVEGGGHLFLDERSLWPGGHFITTALVVRKAFLDAHPDLVQHFLQADVDTVQYILGHPTQTKAIVNSEIKSLTGQALSSQVLDQAYGNLDITYDPLTASLLQSADRAFALGFLGSSRPNLSGLYALSPLSQVLASRGLPPVAASGT